MRNDTEIDRLEAALAAKKRELVDLNEGMLQSGSSLPIEMSPVSGPTPEMEAAIRSLEAEIADLTNLIEAERAKG